MPRESGDFQISELLRITSRNKYAAAVAAFEVVDNTHMIDIPSRWTTRKAAVQSMMALSRELVQFDFINDEQRDALEAELQKSTHRDSAEALFRSPAAAPVLSDSEDELEEIGEIIDERMEGGDDSAEGGEASAVASEFDDDEADDTSSDDDDSDDEGGDSED